EARALVNYFAAVDRLSNPGLGLEYPYLTIPQREESYLAEANREYVARLKKDKKAYEQRKKELEPILAETLQHRLNEAKAALKVAEERLKDKDTKEDEKAGLEKSRDEAKNRVQKLEAQVNKKDFKALLDEWEQKNAYANDAFRLVKNDQLCLTCHQ